MSEQESEATHPPVEQGDMLEQESTWPKKIGVISLIYAIGGLLCQVAMGLATMASEWLVGLQGIEIEMPLSLKLIQGTAIVIVFVIGIFMLVGSIKLLQRKRAGISLLKTWVALRLVMILLGLVIAILTAPAQIEIQKSMLEQTNAIHRKAGRTSSVKEINEEQIQRILMLQVVIFSGIITIYPLFLGLYLSRKKIAEEVQTW